MILDYKKKNLILINRSLFTKRTPNVSVILSENLKDFFGVYLLMLCVTQIIIFFPTLYKKVSLFNGANTEI